MFQTLTRKIFLFTLCIMLVLSASFLQAAPTVIRFSHVVTEETAKGQMAIKFKSLLESKMKGRFVVEIYPNSELFNDDQVFEALLVDDVQMAAPSMSKFNKYNKRLQIFDLPFLFQDMAAVTRFQQSLEGNYLLFNFQERGILGLAYMNNGMKQMSATTKLSLPKDAEGLKFRIQDSNVIRSQFEALNAEALPRPFSQVYSLLASGVVDGQENTWSNIYTKKLHTVQPYITESNHGLNGYVVVTSLRFWETMNAEEQGIFQNILNEAVAYGALLAFKQDLDMRQEVIDSGEIELVTLSDSERAEWVKAMKPVWKQYSPDIEEYLIEKAISSNQ